MPEKTPPPLLLPALHRARSSDGTLTRKALEEIATAVKRPIAEIYSVAGFYHYFAVGGGPAIKRGRCRGPVCSLMENAAGAEDQAHSIACPGLCDQGTAQYEDGRFFSLLGTDGVLRAPRPVNSEQVIFQGLESSAPMSLESDRQAGGYRQLMRLVEGDSATAALNELMASDLIGRGGAGYPLAKKWQAVRDEQGTPKYIVCNADEGEPGTFKDRPILHLKPHLLLESMAICGYLVGAERGIVYLRYEYPEAAWILQLAITQAEQQKLLGDRVGGSGFNFHVEVVRGAGSYVCGEESALLNSLEGFRPWPRERPPFPTSEGLWGKPTVVNNVETLSCVPAIMEKGAAWFRGLGRNGNAGTKIYSVSGKVRKPGNYELPLGITARELIFEHGGGPLDGCTVKAFTLGGISGGLLGNDHLDLVLDYRAPQREGAFLGSGGIIVLDDSCCVVDFTRACMLFYESESCGKCYPCRIGTVRLRELLDALSGKAPLPEDLERQAEEISGVMVATSACGLGQSAPLVVTGMSKYFATEVAAHLKERKCHADVCKF